LKTYGKCVARQSGVDHFSEVFHPEVKHLNRPDKMITAVISDNDTEKKKVK